jgi:hypothetical protein
MGVRTTIGLAVVACGLLGYIVFFERGSLTSGELDKRKADALPEFVRDRVTKLEVQRKGVWTVLERGPDPDNDLDLGGWKLVSPLRADADQDAVEDLLAALEWMSVRRRLGELNAEDRARFGFDTPRVRVRFTVGRGRYSLVVGNPAPGGEGVYVQGSDPSVAHVVGRDLIESLRRDPGDYHTKELHGGLSALTTTRLRVRDATGERVVTKQDGMWWLGDGAERALASEPDVDAAVQALDRVRAKRFVATEMKDAHAYGLAAPTVEFVATYTRLIEPERSRLPVRPPDPAAKPRTEEVTLRLMLGNECEGHAGERYARADAGPVMCVAESDLAAARKQADELRERRLLPVDATGAKSVRLERAGRVLTLSREDDKWSYEVRAGDAVETSGKAREGSVATWLDALARAQAEAFAPLGDAADAGTDGRLRIERESEPAVVEVTLAATDVTDVRARRAGEPWVAVYPASVSALLMPSAGPFRPLRLIDETPDSLRAWEIERGDERERLVRDAAGAWTVEAPVRVDADRVAVAELVRMVAGLEAVGFVADAAEPAHGLDAPWVVARARFAGEGDAKERERVLQLGAATEGGRFARLDGGPAVFVVAPALAEVLARPLANRALIATPVERLDAAVVTRGGRRLAVRREGEAFVTEAVDATDATGAARRLAERLAALRARAVTRYGAARPEEGFARPTAVVRVTARAEGTEEPATYNLLIGAPEGGDAYHARRSDHAVGFLLPKEQAEALWADMPDAQARTSPR